MTEVDLAQVIQDAVRSSRRLAANRGIKVILNQEDTSRCLFQGDYGRLRQMLLIVLDNAVKFSPANSQVSVELDPAGIDLTVTDQGPGIPPTDLPYLFDRFHKHNSSQNPIGTGLGLAIAKTIADRHGITINVTSVPDHGTTFAFHFPGLSNPPQS